MRDFSIPLSPTLSRKEQGALQILQVGRGGIRATLSSVPHLNSEIVYENFFISALKNGYIAEFFLWTGTAVISRLRLDAQLFQFPLIEPNRLGRKPIKGERINLKQLLQDPKQVWQNLTVNWYGGEQKTLECLSFVCLWYHAGELPLELRIVLVKTPNGKNEAEVFLAQI